MAALLQAMYTDNVVFMGGGEARVRLYEVISGIIQGCTGSGCLFTWALDPHLFRIDSDIGPRGESRACADDIALAAGCLEMLKPMATAYKEIEKLTLLEIKAKKCVLIPCRERVSEALTRRWKKWLHENTPLWQEFRIPDCGKYLGVVLGPGAKDAQWQAASAKY